MLNAHDILETITMIQEENLDVRTVTMGISLLDCCDADMARACDRVYDKITRRAEHLVETAEQIRKFDSHVILIFLTSSQDHMKNAFSCHAFDYVEKPVDLEQITNCLLDALKIIPNKDQFFSFLYNNLEIRLMYSEIVCLYADNHSTRIYDVDGSEYRPRMYYGVLAEQLIEDERFLQVSRGVLCNMDHILEMSKRDCKLSSGITVPVTIRNATKLKQQWRDYEFAKIRRSSEERERK